MSALPDSTVLPGEVLDYYLGLGYYRMNQDLFTSRFLPVEDEWYTVHWLRLVVARLAWGSRQRQLWRQNARFAVTVRPFALSAEYEALYARYYQTLAFDTAASLEELLLAGAPTTVFSTYVVDVRDGDRLIAAGIFDRGAASLAGIVNFYDPAYRHFSPGKYLLLRKAAHAQEQRLAYYYPGYVAHGYAKFDYKATICPAATEVFDCLGRQWLPFSWAAVAEQSAALLAG